MYVDVQTIYKESIPYVFQATKIFRNCNTRNKSQIHNNEKTRKLIFETLSFKVFLDEFNPN